MQLILNVKFEKKKKQIYRKTNKIINEYSQLVLQQSCLSRPIKISSCGFWSVVLEFD